MDMNKYRWDTNLRTFDSVKYNVFNMVILQIKRKITQQLQEYHGLVFVFDLILGYPQWFYR